LERLDRTGVSYRRGRDASSGAAHPGVAPPRRVRPQLPARQVAVDHLKGVDPNLGAAFRLAGVKVRGSVVVEEHRDRDREEPTDRRHTNHAAASTGGTPGSRRPASATTGDQFRRCLKALAPLGAKRDTPVREGLWRALPGLPRPRRRWTKTVVLWENRVLWPLARKGRVCRQRRCRIRRRMELQ
jgi:hypothetical protein